MTSFTKKISTERGENIFLVTGGKDQTGRDAWYFIRVESTKINAFRRTIKAGNISLTDYGNILKSGYGKEPSETVITFMREEYGYAG